MKISIATTEKDIAACYPVMKELRPHILEHSFVATIRHQQSGGYDLAFVESEHKVIAVAGFRLGENLAWGRFLYVDDLVTRESYRSMGYGCRLLEWLKKHAARQGCSQLHLDSGLHRLDAHHFYEREGICKSGFHFTASVVPDELS